MAQAHAKEIEAFVRRVDKHFIKMLPKHDLGVECTFLTGSFASWLRGAGAEPSWAAIPDVNYYVLVRCPESGMPAVERILKESISKAAKESGNFNVIIDLHPFSIASGKALNKDGINDLQFTSRVINASLPGLYPPYSWYGWLSNYLLLSNRRDGDPLLALSCLKTLSWDQNWLRNMYLGMLSYGNVLHMIPLFTEDKEHQFDEAFRYLKEIMKDGVSLGMGKEEYLGGSNYEIFKKWRTDLTPYYSERYGKEAADIVSRICEIEKNYYAMRKSSDPISLVEDGIRLRQIVFEKGFKKRAGEICGNGCFKLESFSELPLWW